MIVNASRVIANKLVYEFMRKTLPTQTIYFSLDCYTLYQIKFYKNISISTFIFIFSRLFLWMFKGKKINNFIFSPFTRPPAIIKNKNHLSKLFNVASECFVRAWVHVNVCVYQPTNQPLGKVIKYFYYCNVFDMDGALYHIICNDWTS